MVNSNGESINPIRRHECRYCNELFNSLAVHDLHVMSKHSLRWAMSPRYSTGVFSLATEDLLRIVRREFRSLSASGTTRCRPVATSSPNAVAQSATDNSNGSRSQQKRKADSAVLDNYKREKVTTATIVDAEQRRTSADSRDGFYKQNITELESKTSKRPASPIRKSEASRPINVRTYVAGSLHSSRQSRLAMMGKPYYRDSQHDRRYRSHTRPSGSTNQSTSGLSTTVHHAFRCYTYRSNGRDGENEGELVVFQPVDAADLLCNLTWKETKTKRQKQAIKNEQKSMDGLYDRPRFARRRRARGFYPINGRYYADRYKDYYYYDRESYRNSSYHQRIYRGRIYDARLDKVQAVNDLCCAIKNALHLYLFQSPAGDTRSMVNKAPFWRNNTDRFRFSFNYELAD